MVHVNESYILNWLSEVDEHFDTHMQNHHDDFNGIEVTNHEKKDDRRQNHNEVSQPQIRKQDGNITKENNIWKILRRGNVDALDPFPVQNDHNFRNAGFPHNPNERDKKNGSGHARTSPHVNLLSVRENPRSKGRCEVFDSRDERLQSFPQAYDLGRTENECGRTMKKRHERKPRAKTRPDRYQPKTGKPHKRLISASTQGQNKRSRRKGKRRTLINEDFNATNVTTDRLTIHPGHKMGIFGNGRTSTPVRPRDLPDLTFSEMKFLRKHEDKNESGVQRLERLKSPQISPAKIVQQISQNFTRAGRHTDIKDGRRRNNNHTSQSREYLELTSSAIHYPCYGSTTPSSRQRNILNHNNEPQLLTRQAPHTNLASYQKPQMDSGSTVPYTWSDSEPADDSKDLDPSLLTYVTGILLDSLHPGNSRNGENCEGIKVYYDLEDLQRLCSDRGRFRGFEDESLKNANSRTDTKGSRHHVPTGNSRHSSSNSGRLQKVTDVSRRYHHQKSPRHSAPLNPTVSAGLLKDYTSHNSGSRNDNTSEGFISPIHGRTLPPECIKQSPAYCTRPLEARRTGKIEIEMDDERFGQHHENPASIDLQTEYAISASIPSVDDLLYNLYGNPFSVEELEEIGKNSEMNIWELDMVNKAGMSQREMSEMANKCTRVAPDTSLSRKFCDPGHRTQRCLTGIQDELYDRSAPSPGQVKEALRDSHDMFLPDGFLPLARPISNPDLHGFGTSETRSPIIPGTSYTSTGQLITWRHSLLPTAGIASQNHYIRDATTGFLEQTHNGDISNGTADEDFGPPGFWRQNRLY